MILAPGEHRYRETLYQQPRVPGTGLTNLADLIPEMRRIKDAQEVEKIQETGHFLGLDVHDAGGYDLPLKAGVVITVEPGIYIPEESVGIRIEDDILVTMDGPVLLSKDIPRTVADIERAMAE